MTDGDLICNFKKCRKVLTGTAYITRCSHVFCEDDGLKEIEAQSFEKKCPACQSALVKNYDLVKVTLHPPDQFRSMVLAGLRPEIVMDIATRAIMFWNYQLHQEHLHQEMVAKHLRDLITQMKSDVEVETNLLKSEVQSLQRKCQDLEKELELQNTKLAETTEKLAEKTREVQKLQMMYESLKRKQMSAAVVQRDAVSNFENPIAQNIGPQTMEDLLLANRPRIPFDSRNVHGDPGNRSPCYQEEPRNMSEGFFSFQPRVPSNSKSSMPRGFNENFGQNKQLFRKNYDFQ